MTPYLITLSIGPVKQSIVASRKTADLKAGSQLILEIANAAAKTFEESSDQRIFPRSIEEGGANKILAIVEVNTAQDAQKRALAAEQAAQKKIICKWKKLWENHKSDIKEWIDYELACKQLQQWLEIYSAWTPIREGDYNAARKRVEQLLTGRKMLRNFSSPATSERDFEVPKSPLDPAFDTVLKLKKGMLTVPQKWQNKKPLNLKATELLDAFSIIKRLHLKNFEGSDSKIKRTSDLAHAGATKKAQEKSSFDPTKEDSKPAYPYFAILLADGDSMGNLLDENNSQESHIAISEALDKFAKEAKKIVENHGGVSVYAGGDDVLGLLPVNQALACAQKLACVFKKHLAAFITEKVTPSLSAGIAIVHYREPLSTSLERARNAEKAAKQVNGKNAVCLALHTRGGEPIEVTQKWDQTQVIQDFQVTEFPRGLPYELMNLIREWPKDFDMTVLNAEVQRIARRKRDQDGEQSDVSKKLPKIKDITQLELLAKQLIIARFLSGQGDHI